MITKGERIAACSKHTRGPGHRRHDQTLSTGTGLMLSRGEFTPLSSPFLRARAKLVCTASPTLVKQVVLIKNKLQVLLTKKHGRADFGKLGTTSHEPV
jgi:hypothetical protein